MLGIIGLSALHLGCAVAAVAGAVLMLLRQR